DLGSSNGTRLDGEPVLEPQPLGHLHVITLAERFDFVFQDLDRCAARHRGVGSRQEPGDMSATPGVATAAAAASVTAHTSIEVLDLPLPSLLQKHAPTPPSEKTLLQRLDLPLPSFLKGRTTAPTEAPGGGTEGGTPPSGPESPFASAGFGTGAEQRGKAPRPTRALPGSKVGARGDSEPHRAAEAEGAEAPVAPKAKEARWTLEVPGKAGPERFRLTESEHVVGRSVEAKVVIRSPEVSRRHALLTVRDGRLFVRDLGSRNGTYVDDVRIVAEKELTPGRRLRFGALEVRVIVGGFSDAGRPLPGEKEA
ncbi:MAG: FHA domain-containing protein, partial [Holophagales bacterium]|nr:FHA domain-containing protein [Holophagales bacterium]